MQPMIAQVKASPDQYAKEDRKENWKRAGANTHVGRDCSAQIACQQDAAEDRASKGLPRSVRQRRQERELETGRRQHARGSRLLRPNSLSARWRRGSRK